MSPEDLAALRTDAEQWLGRHTPVLCDAEERAAGRIIRALLAALDAPTEEPKPLTGTQIRKGTGDVIRDLDYARRYLPDTDHSDLPRRRALEFDFVDRALRVAAEEIRQLRKRLDAPREGPGWQPIATAPKDGRLIRLKRVHEGHVVKDGRGYFGTVTVNYGGYAFVNAAMETDYSEPFSEEHRDVWIDEDRRHLFPLPTHWMPLPPPPDGQEPTR